MTRRTLGISLQQLIEDLTPYLIGWRGYFGFCQTPRVLTNLEAWIRRRLRSYLWRQWQNGHNRFNELRRRGVPKFNAAVAAGSPTGFWRMSGHPPRLTRHGRTGRGFVHSAIIEGEPE
jgi:RNA-directed DNA polymerase